MTNRDTSPFDTGEKVMSLILSMLFGLVFKDILSGLNDIFKGINIHPTYPLSNEVCLFLIIIYVANIFRMLHGMILALYDKQRNPCSVGAYPQSFRHLFIIVFTFLLPFISSVLLRMKLHHEYTILFVYQMPLLIYFVWDLDLHRDLKQKLKSVDTPPADIIKSTNYLPYVRWWLTLDLINIAMLLVTALLCTFGTIFDYYYMIFFIFGLVNSFIILSDYVWINRKYYFP